MIPTLNPEIARSRLIYRAARLALLRHELELIFEQTDAAAEKVEQAVTRLARVTTSGERSAKAHQ